MAHYIALDEGTRDFLAHLIIAPDYSAPTPPPYPGEFEGGNSSGLSFGYLGRLDDTFHLIDFI